MIITKTPLRVTLGGGGSDLYPDGFCVTASITQHIYVAINRNFDDDYLLKYSEAERARSVADIKHPLLRRIIERTKLPTGVELSAMADIPAGTGLGSSGAFTVGVLNAIGHYRYPSLPPDRLAALACELDTGMQDQYAAAYGGLSAFYFGEQVVVRPVAVSEQTRAALNDNLLLFYTGIRRSSAEQLDRQCIDLDQTKALGYESVAALEAGQLPRFAGLLTEQWRLKETQTPDWINSLIEKGLAHGAQGGKLVGAGGGGFVMFYTEEPGPLRRALGLREVPFHIESQGSTVLCSQS